MRIAPLFLSAALLVPAAGFAQPVAVDAAYVKSVKDWRTRADQSLRRDDGWLTLAGRYPLKNGENTFGTAPTNDIVFPKGLGPAGMGSIFVEPGKPVRVKLVEGYKMKAEDGEFTEREMGTNPERRDWVRNGRTAFHIIERNGRYVLRLADNENAVRKNFGGRVWYEVDDNYRIPATYVAYDTPRKISMATRMPYCPARPEFICATAISRPPARAIAEQAMVTRTVTSMPNLSSGMMLAA